MNIEESGEKVWRELRGPHGYRWVLAEADTIFCECCEENSIRPGLRRALEAQGWRRAQARYRFNHWMDKSKWSHGWYCPRCLGAEDGDSSLLAEMLPLLPPLKSHA